MGEIDIVSSETLSEMVFKKVGEQRVKNDNQGYSARLLSHRMIYCEHFFQMTGSIEMFLR